MSEDVSEDVSEVASEASSHHASLTSHSHPRLLATSLTSSLASNLTPMLSCNLTPMLSCNLTHILSCNLTHIPTCDITHVLAAGDSVPLDMPNRGAGFAVALTRSFFEVSTERLINETSDEYNARVRPVNEFRVRQSVSCRMRERASERHHVERQQPTCHRPALSACTLPRKWFWIPPKMCCCSYTEAGTSVLRRR